MNKIKTKTPYRTILLVLITLGIFFAYYTGLDKSESNNSERIELPANDNVIDRLTHEDIVVAYIKEYGHLPDYYITKSEAKKSGWIPAEGNLCDVLPGKAIGGDKFGNFEGNLPKKKGRKYTEADINYNCGRRGADRVVYSNDGLIFITHDHYKTFEPK